MRSENLNLEIQSSEGQKQPFSFSLFIFVTGLLAFISLWLLPPLAKNSLYVPYLIATVIFLFSQNRLTALPNWYLFLLGITLDLFSGGPAGFWALLFLLLARLPKKIGFRWRGGFLIQIFALAGCLGLISLAVWGAGSLSQQTQLPWSPLIKAMLFNIVLYPLLFWMLSPRGSRWWPGLVERKQRRNKAHAFEEAA